MEAYSISDSFNAAYPQKSAARCHALEACETHSYVIMVAYAKLPAHVKQ
jgi:hypothetical protein